MSYMCTIKNRSAGLTLAGACPRDLEKREKEAKEREKEERRRKERAHRDAFKELLQCHLAEGVLVARMRWKVCLEPALLARQGCLACTSVCMHACVPCRHAMHARTSGKGA